MNKEAKSEIVSVYDSRDIDSDETYNALTSFNIHWKHEREYALAEILTQLGTTDLSGLRVLDFGCGKGDMILELIRLGVNPSNIDGVELNERRLELLKERVPAQVKIGRKIDKSMLKDGYDIVIVYTVLSSIVDMGFRREVAEEIWKYTTPGSLIFIYDFKYSNPGNKDVRKVTKLEIRNYFPGVEFKWRSIILAPPIARRVFPFSRRLGRLLSGIAFLRTHFMVCVKR